MKIVAPRPTSRWGNLRRFLLIVIVVSYIAILILAPLISLVRGAFTSGLEAFLSALGQEEVLLSFARTLLISLITVFVHALFGTLLAWVMVRHRFPGRSIINALIDMPFAVSPIVIGYTLLLLFGRNSLFAPLLNALNIRIVFAPAGILLATLFVTLPFMARELIPILTAFGIQQEQAAATLGATGWQTFWLVTFPALRWGFIYGLTLTFARALGEFGAVLVVGGGIQGGPTETTTLYIYRALDERQYIEAYSAALALGLFSLILVTISDFLRRPGPKA